MRCEPEDDRTQRLLTILALAVTWSLYSWVRIPVPAVNEPHYLTKALHYWQPDWCAGDLFLESADAHLVYYQTVGALTQWMSLPAAAWCGRLLGFVLLAIGWERLIGLWAPGVWRCTLAAWLFLLLQAAGNFAGEWLVGGGEAKVFAYAFAMWGGGELLRARMACGGLLLGLAVSFHPVVGAWCVLIVGGLAAGQAGLSYWKGRGEQPASARWNWRGAAIAAACLVVASLPGLAPAFSLIGGSDPAVQLQADLIQVGYRLKHHLDPQQFPYESYRYYALLLAGWGLLFWLGERRRCSALEWFTLAALCLAGLGWLAAAGPRPLNELPMFEWRIRLLKLYPFRIADLAVPITVATVVVAAIDSRLKFVRQQRRAQWIAGALGLFVVATALTLPGRDRNPSRMSPTVEADWIDACDWIRRNTPDDALLYAANEDWAVKWYAQRAEYVNYKDCPQDAAGIVEWYRRLVFMSRWARENYDDARFSSAELQDLHEQSGITHLLVSRFGPMEDSPAYANRSFRVFLTSTEPRADPGRASN